MKTHASTLTLLAAILLATAPTETRAGALLDLYQASSSAAEGVSEVENLLVQAAEAGVQTQWRRHLPQVQAQGRIVQVYQDIDQSGNPVFGSGNESYSNKRAGVQIDQPLIDPTIAPLVEAARARLRRAQAQAGGVSNLRTRLFLEGYLRAARAREMLASCERVIARLDKELDAVERSQEVKVAAVSDVQNIRLALAAARRERGNLSQQLGMELAALGTSGEGPDGLPAGDFSALDGTVSANASGAGSTEAAMLRAEAEEAGHRARASRNRSLPVISLVAEYGVDDADGSLFGGPRSYSFVEGGVAVRWAIFDRGMNYSEAREFALRRRAKEAELRAVEQAAEHAIAAENRQLTRSAESVAELSTLVRDHQVLMEASARAYEAGKDSYVNAVTSFIAYESAVRDLTSTRHEHLVRAVAVRGRARGWGEALVRDVDTLFAAH